MTAQHHAIDRRVFLRGSAALAALPVAGGLLTAGPASAAPATATSTAAATAAGNVPPAPSYPGLPFVDDYLTNTTANRTPQTNAAVRILAGFEQLWTTGSSWDNGVPRSAEVLRANIRYVVKVGEERTDAEAKQAYIFDRQHQSYSAISGLGPLTQPYLTGSLAVTGITAAPDGVPAGRVSDALPPDAPAGSSLGAGSTSSALGTVVQLVNTIRGPHASSNPSKSTYQYPRPWRLTDDSKVVETGGIPVLGVPVYAANTAVVPQLLRQRADNPADDGGFPSGHANAAYLAALAFAYAVPERFQELLARASDVADSRIVAGMHSPVDVIGGRILATALAAAVLADPAYAQLKADARRQAAEYLQARTGTSADTLYAYAHSAGPDTDPYADRAANLAKVTPRLTYMLPQARKDTPFTVPKGAETLIETRLPYLDAEQRREVLRSTGLPGGYPLLDGPEQWGRLNLFAAADGYGSLRRTVRVTMDAAAGGFHAADAWRNDIDGEGMLVKSGTGALTLSGANSFTGGTRLVDGTLTAASERALGDGPVELRGGALRLDRTAGQLRVRGEYSQSGQATLAVNLTDSGEPPLVVDATATLNGRAALVLALDPERPPAANVSVPVLRAAKLTGTFGSVTVTGIDGYTAEPFHTGTGVSVRLLKTA
ncbi:phosphatase PAP2 family protein [Micromonospora sp. NBC_01813]|uniref:phosphatase PAP2 family protein n=1 Tax=Micromonospora sp. NBC_01813 TaxID=2975988 RepID=UPI002DDB21BB|nr:phosphatase PAP2 family protein [Micromonospora sp. NBC_01813]WSA11170.1 phosphatase PAP2 family protein [Micromonospora sp. NBC_01813]